jgi:hypothetical protein
MRTYPASSELAHDDQRTYDRVFQHPITANLDRRDVRSMFEALGTVIPEHNGDLKVQRNGHTLVLHPAHSNHPAGHEEVMTIRHFLEASKSSEMPAGKPRTHLLVIVEHRQVLIYRTDFAHSLPEQIAPYDPEHNGQHVHSIQDHKGNLHRPAAPTFYTAIAKSLRDADEILIFATRACGKTLMDNLLAELELNHAEVARRVLCAILVDDRHITEEDLLAKARKYYHDRLETSSDASESPLE